MRQRPAGGATLALWISIATAFGLLAACGADDSSEPAGQATTETTEVATVSVGMPAFGSGAILWSNVEDEGLDEKYGLDLELTRQTAFDVLYQDFAAGRYDIVQASPGGVPPLASGGVPVEILFPFALADFYMVAPEPLEIPDDLEGLTFTGATNSGSYRLTAALLEDIYGFDLLANTVPGADNLEAIAQVQSGTADAAIVWEFDLTTALARFPDLQVVWDPREAFRESHGGELWGVVFAYRTDAGYSSEVLDRFRDMIAEAAENVNADPDRAVDLVAETLDLEPGALLDAFAEERVVMKVPEDAAQAKDEMRAALELQASFEDMTIPDGIFGD